MKAWREGARCYVDGTGAGLVIKSNASAQIVRSREWNG